MMTNLSLMRTEEDEEVEEKPFEAAVLEKEHMFDKVVTPSDVGKLNRLVIPKQHAERYFPLDSSSNEKGLLLNFEDLTGKSWRFRYSYWNSSQSYVMTKGWSRFVKDKKLDAGDIVSFQRCIGDSGRDSRLFIDWRKRPKIPDPNSITHFPFPRFYSFSNPTPSTSYNLYNNTYGFHQIPRELGYGYFVRSLERNIPPMVAVADPLVIESVPVMIHGRGQRVVETAVGKRRLRLFGVDMECGGGGGLMSNMEEESSSSGGSVPRGGGAKSGDQFSKKGKSSLSFDLDDQ